MGNLTHKDDIPRLLGHEAFRSLPPGQVSRQHRRILRVYDLARSDLDRLRLAVCIKGPEEIASRAHAELQRLHAPGLELAQVERPGRDPMFDRDGVVEINDRVDRSEGLVFLEQTPVERFVRLREFLGGEVAFFLERVAV